MLNSLLASAWLIPVYPLAGAALSVIWFPSVTRRTGPRPSGYVNAVMTLTALVHCVLALIAIWDQPAVVLQASWLDVAGLHLSFPFELSRLTIGAATLITGLNLAAQFYAFGYLEMDWGWARFFSLLGLFEGGMTALTMCDSLFFSYVILEVLTLGTYLLLGMWFNQSLVVSGARDAFLTKRVGDLFLLMGVVALLPLAGTWNFTDLAAWAAQVSEGKIAVNGTLITLITLGLLAGPMGKCAQFPLHLWLDEAMEGPLPGTVLRNSVVVATGTWVLVKLAPVMALSQVTMTVMAAVGLSTAVGATLIAIAQIDIKRALSYLSSAFMGLTFIAIAMKQTDTALMLVFTFGLSIALAFMAVGNVIWNCTTQDLRQYGGLWSRRPISGIALLVALIGMVAVPPFGGFWALERLVSEAFVIAPWLGGILLVVNGLVALGLMRIFGLIFAGKPKQMTERSPEIHWPMAIPTVVMVGVVLHEPQLLSTWGLVKDWTILTQPTAIALITSSALGIVSGAALYCNDTLPKPIQFPLKSVQDFLAYDLYTPQLYKMSIVSVVDRISKLADWLDRNLVDGVGQFFGLATLFSGQSLRYSTAGQSQVYMLTIVIGLGLLVLLAFNIKL